MVTFPINNMVMNKTIEFFNYIYAKSNDFIAFRECFRSAKFTFHGVRP